MNFFSTLLIAVFSVNSFASEDLNGLWIWDNNSDKHTFSITLEQTEDGYRASYCAIGLSGRRIDCATKYKTYFTTQLLGEDITFKTHYSNASGKAKLKIMNGKLKWDITEPPRGEHYAPGQAVLVKAGK
ncbi:hypothetical protein GCM10009092_20140 [Bowmanella denitrificans]|uniref:Uncharacterized protein n=1 Tax=Bowmanella denitrificans TaxID=366582 RepID=A0ABN0X5R1_9ALTE